MAAGDFIQRVAVQMAAARMWADGRQFRELKKPINTALAVLSEQNVRFGNPIFKNGVCVGIEVIYLKSCDEDVVDTSLSENNLSDCDVSGTQAESAKKTYNLNVSITKAIKVSMDDCAGFATFEEKLAFLKLQAMASIEKDFNNKVIATIEANKQTNAHAVGGSGGGTSTISFPSIQWDAGEGAKLMSKLYVSAERNQIYDAYIMNGLNFYEAKWLYQYKEKAGSDERYDSVFDLAPYNLYWDIINLDSVVGSTPSYVIDRSALAFHGQNEYASTTPVEIKADMVGYRQAAPRLKYNDGGTMVPAYFDVVEQVTCTQTAKDPAMQRRYRVLDVEFTLRGALVTGPPDCGGGTGILKFDRS